MFGIYPYEGIGVQMAAEVMRVVEKNPTEDQTPKREPRFRLYRQLSRSFTLLLRRRQQIQAQTANYYDDPLASEC